MISLKGLIRDQSLKVLNYAPVYGISLIWIVNGILTNQEEQTIFFTSSCTTHTEIQIPINQY